MNTMLTYNELSQQIQAADKGIEAKLIPTVGGELVTLHRQGRPTAWHIFLANNGTGKICKSKTASLPEVLLEFTAQYQHNIKPVLVDYIEHGWI